MQIDSSTPDVDNDSSNWPRGNAHNHPSADCTTTHREVRHPIEQMTERNGDDEFPVYHTIGTDAVVPVHVGRTINQLAGDERDDGHM